MASFRRAVAIMLEPLRARVASMVARGVVSLVNDSPRMQELQLQLLAGETADGAERFQDYGFTSVPLPPNGDGEAEAVVVCPMGSRDHPIVVAVGDRRYRLTGLEAGEVAIYDDLGGKIHLTREGMILSDPAFVKIEVGASSLTVRDNEIVLVSPSIELNDS